MDFLHESELFLLTNERNLSNSRIEVRSDEGARLHEHDQQSKPAHGSGTRGCHRCVQVVQLFLNWTFFWPSANNSNQELLERQCLIFSFQKLWDRSEGSDNSPKGWFKKMLLFIEIFSLINFFSSKLHRKIICRISTKPWRCWGWTQLSKRFPQRMNFTEEEK